MSIANLQLLDGRLAPLTFSVGFVEAPFADVRSVYVDWMKTVHGSVEVTPIDVAIEEALLHLEPLTTPPTRDLLLSTNSTWTAYFDNGIRGPDPRPRVAYLSQQLACLGVVATCVPHTLESDFGSARGTYGAVQFELFGPIQRECLNYVRSVGVAFDGGRWRFDVAGTVQAFEETEKYTEKRIVDRFTPGMLQRYCNALNIGLFDESFYTRPGVLVVVDVTTVINRRQVSLSDARRELALG